MQTRAETAPQPTTPRRRSRWRRIPWAVFAGIVLILAFQVQQNMQQALTPPSPEWSRPLTLDTAGKNRSISQAVLPDGRLLVVRSEEKGFRSYVVTPQGAVASTHNLLSQQVEATGVRVVVAGGQPRLFWLDYPTRTLFTADLTADGAAAGQGRVIDTGIKGFAVTVGGTPLAPRVLAITDTGATLIVPSGDRWQRRPLPAPVPNTTAVDMTAAQDGTVYAALAQGESGSGLQGERFSLLRLSPVGELTVVPLAQRKLEEMKDSVGTVAIGIDRQNGYLFWDVTRNDRGVRSTQSEFVTWPLAQVPSGPLAIQPFRLDEASSLQASSPNGIRPAPGQADALFVAVPATVGSGRERVVETLQVTFQGGKLTGQQLAGPAPSFTLQPQLAVNGDTHWLTWVVPGGDGVTLRIGSTAPAFRRAMGRISSQDWQDAIGTALIGIGYAYLPLVVSLLWLLPPIIFVVLFYLLALNWAERNPLILNLGGLVVYLVAKLRFSQLMLFRPSVLAHMPPWLGPHAVWIGVATLLVAALELFRLNRRWLQSSVTSGLVPLALFDAVLMALAVAPYMR